MNMKKILITGMVSLLVLVALSGATQGTIDDLQGYFVDSNDGQARFYDGTDYHANITAVADPSGMIAINTGVGGAYFSDFNAGTFVWMGDHATAGWKPDMAPVGDTVYFASEHDAGYFWAAYRVSTGSAVANPLDDLFGQYEPIAVPYVADTENDIGTDFITLTIDAPKYTCRYGDTDPANGGTHNQGQFELVTSYAVFLTDGTYLGNADTFVAGPDQPLRPYMDDGVDPSGIDTGHYTLLVENLTAGTTYEFMVRPNLDMGTYEGGYGGGLGSYTLWGAGGSSGPIVTDEDPVSEFGPGMLIPVVAIIGMFVAFTVYRRKKDE